MERARGDQEGKRSILGAKMEIDEAHVEIEDALVHGIKRINLAILGRVNSASLDAPELICEHCGIQGDCDCPLCRVCMSVFWECECFDEERDELKRNCADYEFVKDGQKYLGEWKKTGGSNGASGK